MIGGDSKFVLTCTHTRVPSQLHTQHIIHFEKDSPNGGRDRIILHFPIRNRKEEIFWCRQVGLVLFDFKRVLSTSENRRDDPTPTPIGLDRILHCFVCV
jgi:hypothetical protein